MLLKILIVVLFIGVIASLTSALNFLIRDMEVKGSKRTAILLGVRISLAATLLLVIAYGIYSGQLGNTAPWGDHRSVSEEASE